MFANRWSVISRASRGTPGSISAARSRTTSGMPCCSSGPIPRARALPRERARRLEHLGDPHELHARAALRLAGGALAVVDCLPALPRHVVGRAPPQPRLDVLVARRVGQQVGVLDDVRDRLGGALLVGADDAAGAALDPADGVLAAQRPAVFAEDTAVVVGDAAGPGVDRDAGDRLAAVADRAQDEAALEHLLVAGRHGAPLVDPVVDDAHGAHAALLVAEDLDRRAQEAQLEPARLAGRLARRVVAQRFEVALGGGVRGLLDALELRWVDDHVGLRELAELAQLRRRERSLRGPAAAEDDDLLHARLAERRQRLVGGVGR